MGTKAGYGFPERFANKDESNEQTAARALEQTGFKYPDVSRLYDYDYIDNNVRYFVGVLTEEARKKLFKPQKHVLELAWEKDGYAQIKLGKSARLLRNAYFDIRRDYFSDDDLD